MDLESECSGSALESVEDSEDVTLDIPRVCVINSKVETDGGSCGNGIRSSSCPQNPVSESLASELEVKKDVESTNPAVYSSPSRSGSSSVPGGSPPPVVTKGYGLKKWRRIKRDLARDSSPNVDNSKMLKRASSSSVNTERPHRFAEANQMSDGSVGSVNMLVRNSVAADYLDPRVPISPGFTVGLNPEEISEDHSSKSSTAASAPKSRYEMHTVSGNARERNKMKNPSGKAAGSSGQKIQQGKGRIETGKKARGEWAKVEKENSQSSLESDSRSSNFVFLQGASLSVINNGKKIGRSNSHEIEYSDEGRMNEPKFSEGHQTCILGDNGEQVDHSHDDLHDGLSWEGKDGRSNNHPSSTVEDPLAKSLVMLQSVQEALENEVKKFGEIGRESASSPSVVCNGSSSHPNSLETQVRGLKERVRSLETQLEETFVTLKEKESRVVELEAALFSFNSPTGEAAGSQTEKCGEMESEVEALFREKIEAEIECVSIAQKLRFAEEDEDQGTVPEERRAVAVQQAELRNELEEAEGKIAALKKRAEDWEATRSEDVSSAEEAARMERRVLRVTACFFIQLVLLVVAFGLVILQLQPPSSSVVVPT